LISFCIFFLSSSEIASFNSAYFLLIFSSILPNEPSLYCGFVVTLVVVILGVFLPVFLPPEAVDDVLPDEVLPLDDEVPPDGLLPPTASPTSLFTVILVDATFKPNHLLKSVQTPYIF
jgi:hypothetical protein